MADTYTEEDVLTQAAIVLNLKRQRRIYDPEEDEYKRLSKELRKAQRLFSKMIQACQLKLPLVYEGETEANGFVG